jgi:hypothetical protein
MKNLVFIALISTVFSITTNAVSLYSRNNGNWNSNSTWSTTSGGASCGCTPGASDNVYINHNVGLNKDLTSSSGISGSLTIYSGASLVNTGSRDLEVKNGGLLDLRGTLTVFNMTFDNGSTVIVSNTGNITVNGTFQNKNNSNNVTINGSVTVMGPFTNGNGSAISGTGTITIVVGSVTNNGTVFGCTTIPILFPAIYPCGGIPLPVELTDFKALTSKDNNVLLNWSTASETINKFFTLERSEDAKIFKAVTEIPGSGTTSAATDYEYEDKHVPSGQLYYRLSQSDYNGKKNVLKTLCVSIKAENCIRIQVPAASNNNNLNVHFNCNNANSATIIINDLYGNCLNQKVITVNDHSCNLNNFCQNLQTGIYVITVIADNSVAKKQFWKF